MKNLNRLLILLALPLICVSCIVDDDENTGLQDAVNSPIGVGFSASVALESYFEDIGPITKEYPVNVLGGNSGYLSSTDLVVNYDIDPSSTATEDAEFSFVDTSGTLTIPAGSSFAQFPLIINTGGLDPDMPTELILNLTSVSGDAYVSSINNVLRITFVGCQSTLNNNTYNVVTTRDSDNAVVNFGTQDIRITDPNTFITRSTGLWAVGTIAADQGLTFTDVCGDLTINAQNLCQGTYSNQVTGTGANSSAGTVDPLTGDFTLKYSVTFSAGDQTYTSVYTKL
tara:strand:+ start:12869 stop:13720 length:852 start_codon:yes stop_codon:yes gene_type:complete